MTRRWVALCVVVQALACGGESDETRTMQTENMMEESDMMQPSTMREGPPGCYLPSEMACDCELTEAECLQSAGMVWVANGCASCE